MRHAAQYVTADGARLKWNSVEICQRNVQVLGNLIKPHKNDIRIFHSPTPRALMTAGVVYDSLFNLLRVRPKELEEVDWLDCSKHSLNNNNVTTLITPAPTAFFIFISHMLEIEQFLGDKHEPKNCDIISKHFSISGGRQTR